MGTVPPPPIVPGYSTPGTVLPGVPTPGTTSVHRPPVLSREQGPGLREARGQRAGSRSSGGSPLRFPHPRSVSPGHPDRPQTIRDKCWIASRSRAAWAALDRGPGWSGTSRPRASWEALGPWIRAIRGRIQAGQAPGSGHPGPGSRPSWPAQLARKQQSRPVLTEV